MCIEIKPTEMKKFKKQRKRPTKFYHEKHYNNKWCLNDDEIKA